MKRRNEAEEPFQGSICPACERYIGPKEECPYCGANSARDPVLRMLKWGAVFFALTGVALLYLTAAAREAPVVRAGEVTPMMNHAFVRITGTVDEKAFIGRRNGKVDYMSFPLSDSSGVMRVCMYRKVARDLSDQNRIPGKNTRIEVRGSLNVAEDNNVKLIVQSADHVRILQ